MSEHLPRAVAGGVVVFALTNSFIWYVVTVLTIYVASYAYELLTAISQSILSQSNSVPLTLGEKDISDAR